MFKNYLTLLSFLFIFCNFNQVYAQSGCPGCQTNLPANLPVDTVYLPAFPDGQVGVAYDQDISFRMPKTTTPVAAIDSTTPPGLTINSIEIVGVEGLPPGLSWEPSQFVFPVATETDGCIKICGTPTQSDSFIVTVKLKATILFFSQEATFPLRIYIAPGTSQNDGFSMLNPVGCGSTTVEFTNNITSGGNPGFTYTWDFGDSTTYEGENPPPHEYTTPGTYIVDYKAVIDTADYTLLSVILLNLECVDLLGLGKPDVYVLVKDSTGTEVFNSSPDITDINLPYTLNIGIQLQSGTYMMEIWDEDSGLKGGDDKCGAFPFTVLSNGNVVAGGFSGILNIYKPIKMLHYKDTVIVHPVPAAPTLTTPKGVITCADNAPLPLISSITGNIQWYVNAEPITAATDSIYLAEESGFYQVVTTSAEGCIAFSEGVDITITPLPPLPLFSNNGKNLLIMFDTINLPASYQLQWYLNGQTIPNADGFWYCSMESGVYTLEIIDLNTECINLYQLNVVYNPAFDCTVGDNEVVLSHSVNIFPNPANDLINIQLQKPAALQSVSIIDMNGKTVNQVYPSAVSDFYQIHCNNLPDGVYRLVLQTSDTIESFQISVIR